MHLTEQPGTNASSPPHSADEHIWLRRVLWLLAGFLAIRLLVTATIPLDLVHDEAYYWDCSRRLDWYYYSKPPMVAWLIAGFTHVGGDSTFVVRLPAIFLGTGAAWFVFLLARDMYGARAGFWSAALFLTAPGAAALGLLMTNDAPLLFCWSVALFAFWRILHQDTHRFGWLCVLTLAIGIGLLSKQTMLAFMGLSGMFLLTSREDRQAWRRPAVWICWIGSLCFLVPLLWWNVQNDWIILQHTNEYFSTEQVSAWRRVVRGFEFIGSFSAVTSPYLSWLFCAAAISALWHFSNCDRRRKYLLMFSAVPLMVVTGLAFKQRVEPNWPAPVCIAGVILLVGHVRTTQIVRVARRNNDRRLATALGIATVATLVMYVASYGLVLKGTKLDPGRKMRGWSELGRLVGEEYRRLPKPNGTFLIVTNGQAFASELAFYMPQHPTAFVWNRSGRSVSQYDVWGGPLGRHGQDALLVSSTSRLPGVLAGCFSHVAPLPGVEVSLGHGKSMSVHLWRGCALDERAAAQVAGFSGLARGQYASRLPTAVDLPIR